jgi:hypothetical protein
MLRSAIIGTVRIEADMAMQFLVWMVAERKSHPRYGYTIDWPVEIL